MAPDRPAKDWLKGLRERQAKFLFQNFGAGLKAMAYLIEYRHALKKYPFMEENERAYMVATLINADFGGLHLGRMERSPLAQHIFRLLALAPDWTESNIQTVYGMFTKVQGLPDGSPQQIEAQKHLYRRFWAGALTKGIGITVLANLALCASSGEDPWENFKKAWGKDGEWRYLRWLGVDVTHVYRLYMRMLGKTPSEARKYFNLIGHFKDPIKWGISPIRSMHHKGSVLYRTFHEALSGTNWQGRGFTTVPEFLGVDDKGIYLTTTKTHKAGDPKGGKLKWKTLTWGRKGALETSQVPSYLMHTAKSIQPIQIQELIGIIVGENESFEAIGRGMGLGISSPHVSPRKLLKEYAEYYIEIRKNKGNMMNLKKKVGEMNARRRKRGEDQIPWIKVKEKALRIIQAEARQKQLERKN